MNKKLIVILGNSQAGKSTLVSEINKKFCCVNISPIAPLKNHLEVTFNLPKGALEDYEYKSKKLPSGKYTYQGLLEDTFHFWQKHEPLYSTYMLESQLINFAKGLHDIEEMGLENELACISSVRFPEEANRILEVSKVYNLPVLALNIVRESSNKLSTDCYLEKILEIFSKNLEDKNYVTLKNDTTISELFWKTNYHICKLDEKNVETPQEKIAKLNEDFQTKLDEMVEEFKQNVSQLINLEKS